MFGTLTLREVQRWLEGACRRDAYEMARTTRAVWAGSQLDSEGVNSFIQKLLGEDSALPPEQALFAMQASTMGLPKINMTSRARAA